MKQILLILFLFLVNCCFGQQLIFQEIIGVKHHCPAIVELSDGTLLCVWYCGKTRHAEGDDAGQLLGSVFKEGIWSKVFVVFDADRRADCDPVLFYDKGKLHLFFGVMHSLDNDWSSLSTHWLCANVYGFSDIKIDEFEPINWVKHFTLNKYFEWEDIDLYSEKDKVLLGVVLKGRPIEVNLFGARYMILPMTYQGKIKLMYLNLGNFECFVTEVRFGFKAQDYGPNIAQPVLVYDNDLFIYFRNILESGDNKVLWTHFSNLCWQPLKEHSYLPNHNNALDIVCLHENVWLAVYNTDRSRRELRLGFYNSFECKTPEWRCVTLYKCWHGELSEPYMILSKDRGCLHIVYSYHRRVIAYKQIKISDLFKLDWR